MAPLHVEGAGASVFPCVCVRVRVRACGFGFMLYLCEHKVQKIVVVHHSTAVILYIFIFEQPRIEHIEDKMWFFFNISACWQKQYSINEVNMK